MNELFAVLRREFIYVRYYFEIQFRQIFWYWILGMLASFDPVALDQACVDLIYQAEGNAALVKRIENKKGIHTLEHAEAIGLGSRAYELVKIDD